MMNISVNIDQNKPFSGTSLTANPVGFAAGWHLPCFPLARCSQARAEGSLHLIMSVQASENASGILQQQ